MRNSDVLYLNLNQNSCFSIKIAHFFAATFANFKATRNGLLTVCLKSSSVSFQLLDIYKKSNIFYAFAGICP